jgi:peptidoglycan L-alanyl-D-glutamate endopeptidase CwlK
VLDRRSQSWLREVHPDLRKVIEKASLGPITFFVTEGVRTLERQRQLFAAGASKTMNSRHLPGKTNGLSHAVDLAVTLQGEIRWDWPLYAKLAEQVKAAASELGVPITWGGDWKSLKDGPHFELPWEKYPG